MKRTILRIAAWLVVGLVAILFARALQRDWDNVRDTVMTISWVSWTSILFFVFAVVVSGVLWGRIVTRLSGQRVTLHDAVRIHAASWLLKYVPGQVGSLVNKISWGSKHGYKKKLIATSVLYENVLMVFASLILSVPLLFVAASKLTDSTIVWALVMIVPMLVVCNQRVFYTLLNAVLKIAKRKPLLQNELLTSRQIFANTLYYMIPRILNGIGFVVIASAMFAVTPDMYVPVASIFIFAGIIGMLALFVPSGIGVREGIIVLLMSVYIPADQAIVLALVARFFTTIADLGVLVLYLLLNKGKLTQ